MHELEVDATFVLHLHHALKHLYDPAELRTSPLTVLVVADSRDDPATRLRTTLIKAMDALKPADGVPQHHSPLWRDYRILYSRFTEQFIQQEVAADLGLSIRQLRRQEKSAVDALATHLWLKHGLAGKFSEPHEAPAADETVASPMPSMQQELAWLHKSAADELASIDHLIQTATSTATPLAKAHGGQIRYKNAGIAQQVAMQPAMLQQALLNILTAAIGQHPGEIITIGVETGEDSLTICVEPINADRADDEAIRMARELAEICGGLLAIATPLVQNRTANARLTLPAVPQTHVLVIDDNPDTLRLFQRYSSGTSYRITGIQDSNAVVLRAADSLPQIIVLDVMMPGLDGWELLGRLREHPQLRGTPIIVATILPQEQLALALGASAFVRKPVGRRAFLSALDAQAGQRDMSAKQ